MEITENGPEASVPFDRYTLLSVVRPFGLKEIGALADLPSQ
jgi:hypothetical protein